ncbi:hypothetical protein CJ305_10660 [Leeuwenhoekiella nanhaiensis]|uniref:S1 motif domain-containing protein n=1 Tax=Leeuwenhoekiella nanhaiensis TaxID=1655491 RepID=A0A2G1VRJ6_9FLAO|nr:hypothetical protein CJ305_10660 [Leeuwenhoekiella nanhaiensis]
MDETKIVVNFELVECNYDFVRIGDEIFYDLVQIYDGSYEALNIEFKNNSILSELDSAYQKQNKLQCKVNFKTPNGFVLDYKGVSIYLPNKELQGTNLVEGSDTTLYIKHFSYNANIICSLNSNSNSNLVSQFQKYIGKSDSFNFEIIEINNSGLIVADSSIYGFIPNSHLGKISKDKIRQGNTIKASVIACSLKGGLVLSIRNHLLYDILVDLNDAFNNQICLSGEIKSFYKKYFIIDYKGIDLLLNKNYVLNNDNIDIKQSIYFKIIDFSWTKTISISVLETSENGLVSSFRRENLFIGTVQNVMDSGLLISINENYIGFMPNFEITNNWKLDLSIVKEGQKIKASITKFNYQGLYLSRLLYTRKIRSRLASKKIKINDTVVLKIYDKMAKFGVLVRNEAIKGLIPLENILPKEIIEQINILNFVKYCKLIFKKKSLIKCIVSEVDDNDNKIAFDINVHEIDNKEKIIQIFDYFKNNTKQKIAVIDFYNKKARKDL